MEENATTAKFSYHLEMDNFTLNESAEETANRFLQVYVLFTLAAFGFVGNFTIIFVLCKKRKRERFFTNINFLILQLAISDLLVVSFCLFADALWKATYCWLAGGFFFEWEKSWLLHFLVAGDFMCRFVKFMQMFSLYASTYVIVTISFDRAFAILCPITRFDHHNIVKRFVICAWILAVFCSIPQVRRRVKKSLDFFFWLAPWLTPGILTGWQKSLEHI